MKRRRELVPPKKETPRPVPERKPNVLPEYVDLEEEVFGKREKIINPKEQK
jgi:hypothetical protein